MNQLVSTQWFRDNVRDHVRDNVRLTYLLNQLRNGCTVRMVCALGQQQSYETRREVELTNDQVRKELSELGRTKEFILCSQANLMSLTKHGH